MVNVCIHHFRISQPGWKHSAAIAIATVGFMLPWQFAQFALMTQVCMHTPYYTAFLG